MFYSSLGLSSILFHSWVVHWSYGLWPACTVRSIYLLAKELSRQHKYSKQQDLRCWALHYKMKFSFNKIKLAQIAGPEVGMGSLEFCISQPQCAVGGIFNMLHSTAGF